MTVKELITALSELPNDARVFHLWDGEPRTEINFVWQARSGDIITSDYSMVCYSNESRPKNAPTSKEDPYWATESDPNRTIDDF